MTFKYNQVFVEDAATIAGPYEAKGPLKNILNRHLIICIMGKSLGKRQKRKF